MKLIFLDVDGVLNNKRTFELKRDPQIEKDCVEVLKTIMQETAAYVVVSSTWRIHRYKELKYILRDMGVDVARIFDSTLHFVGDREAGIISGARGSEIADWLRRRGHDYEVSSFIILDDGDDMGEALMPYLIRTNYLEGLTPELGHKAISMLNNRKNHRAFESYIETVGDAASNSRIPEDRVRGLNNARRIIPPIFRVRDNG